MATLKQKRPVKKDSEEEKQELATINEWGLKPKQEEFCTLYATDREFLGNGTQCYLEVYGYKDDESDRKISYESAKANASRLLTNDNIIKRINSLLEAEGFTDENIDKQHLFLANQFADLKTKLGAIREYNALKKRVKAEGSDQPKELHLHLHRTEKVVKIVGDAEEQLRKELANEISLPKADAESKGADSKADSQES